MARKDYAAEKGKHVTRMVGALQQQVSLACNLLLCLDLLKPWMKMQPNAYWMMCVCFFFFVKGACNMCSVKKKWTSDSLFKSHQSQLSMFRLT